MAVAAAGLVGTGLPESAAGGGLGWLGTAVVLFECGRVAAPVPALTVMALTAPALADRPDLVDGVAAGEVIVTAAIHEPAGDPWRPSTSVTDGWLSGTKVCVPHGLLAARFVGTAADGLYAVDADAPGVTVTREDTTSGVPGELITLQDPPAERIGGADAVHELLLRGSSVAAMIVAGMTGPCSTSPPSTRSLASSSASRSPPSRPSASGSATPTSTTRPSGSAPGRRRGASSMPPITSTPGVGVDRDYPLHRYFLAHNQLELQLGSATPTLQRLGARLAAE